MCIIQDDLDIRDWKAQSSLTGSIYKNQSRNIAAAWAEDSNDERFRERDPADIADAHEAHGDNLDQAAIDYYYDGLVEAPLNKQYWVIQERYPARRQLSFAENSIHWGFSELSASEKTSYRGSRVELEVERIRSSSAAAGRTEGACRNVKVFRRLVGRVSEVAKSTD